MQSPEIYTPQDDEKIGKGNWTLGEQSWVQNTRKRDISWAASAAHEYIDTL